MKIWYIRRNKKKCSHKKKKTKNKGNIINKIKWIKKKSGFFSNNIITWTKKKGTENSEIKKIKKNIYNK